MDDTPMMYNRDFHVGPGFGLQESTSFVAGGLLPTVTDHPDFFANVAPAIREWDQIRVISRDHEWERLLRVEHKDGNKVLTRVLTEWRAPTFPESELHRLGLSVVWMGHDRWAVVADNGSEPIKKGFATRALAVEALRAVAGVVKAKPKKEAA